MPGPVPWEQPAASQALQSMYSSTGGIVGPALGGLLIAATGVGATYSIDTATFAPSLVAALLIAPAPPREAVAQRALESLREGWRFLVRQRVILGTFLLDTNAMVFGMPQALFPAVAISHFDGTPDRMRGRMQGFELAQVASTPAIGNVEAGLVASLTSLRFSIVSGVVCAVGTVAIVAAVPSLLRYDARSRAPEGHVRGTVPGTDG